MFLKQMGILNLFRLTILFQVLRFVIVMRLFFLAYQKRHLEKLTRWLVSGRTILFFVLFWEILQGYFHNMLSFIHMLNICFTNQ